MWRSHSWLCGFCGYLLLCPCYFACSSRIVTEYGGTLFVKSLPNPLTFALTGTIFVGSVMEFVSLGLLELIIIVFPCESTDGAPLIAM